RAPGALVVLNQDGGFYPVWAPHGGERENARMAKVHVEADYVFSQSEFCRHYAERFLGERAGRSEILYNAVDPCHFTPGTAAVQNRPFTFLMTGKFSAPTSYRLSSSIAGLAAARAAGLDLLLRISGLIDPPVEC